MQGARTDCCSRATVAVTAKAASEPNAQTFTAEVPDKPRECMTRTTFKLGPKKSVEFDAHGQVSMALELTIN